MKTDDGMPLQSRDGLPGAFQGFAGGLPGEGPSTATIRANDSGSERASSLGKGPQTSGKVPRRGLSFWAMCSISGLGSPRMSASSAILPPELTLQRR